MLGLLDGSLNEVWLGSLDIVSLGSRDGISLGLFDEVSLGYLDGSFDGIMTRQSTEVRSHHSLLS